MSANGPNGSSGCRSSGVAVFPRGASVNVATAAQPGSVFSNFEGGCTFSDGDTIVMDHAGTLIANFVASTAPPPPAPR